MKIGKFGLINNFLPYYYIEKNGGYEVIESYPKNLAEMLLRGKIDYAPVPSYFYLKNRDKLRRYRFCVASDGEVYSVVVVSKKKRLDDSPIALTTKSLTSVKMLEIIKKEKGLINKLIPHSGNFFEMLKDFDHALVIGDDAIKARMIYRVVMDIGEEWKELTDLPVVFGIASSIRDAEKVDEDILHSYEKGLKNIDSIVDEASRKFRMPIEFLRAYFERLIHVARKREIKSLKVFEEFCHDYGLL